jgi:hypothetical protein
MRCEECYRLWNAYQLATIEDVRLSGKLDAAVISRDREEFNRANAESEAAQNARLAAREAIADH